jgi:hypothetical protein
MERKRKRATERVKTGLRCLHCASLTRTALTHVLLRTQEKRHALAVAAKEVGAHVAAGGDEERRLAAVLAERKALHVEALGGNAQRAAGEAILGDLALVHQHVARGQPHRQQRKVLGGSHARDGHRLALHDLDRARTLWRAVLVHLRG